MRVLFDTNVLLAAFLSEGLCSKLLRRAAHRHFELFLSPSIIAEFKDKLRKKFKVDSNGIKTVTALVLEASSSAELLYPVEIVAGVSRDPDDDHVLASALTQRVQFIVTGDKDLLDLKRFRNIEIISPRDFELIFADSGL